MDETLRRVLTGIAGIVVAAVMGTAPEVPRPAASAPSADTIGLPAVGVGSHVLNRQAIGQLDDLGVRHVRHTLYWSHWQDAEYRRTFRNGIERAHRAGLDVLVVVHQQPSGGYADRQRVYREFAAFMEARAREFPGVRAWQLWNEMDVAFTDVFGATHSGVSLRERGRNYGAMLDLAYPAIKRGNPEAVVVTGGIASGPAAGFLQGIYDTGASFDVVGLHAYGFPVAGAVEARGEETRQVMRANGDSSPIWLTEFGTSREVIPPDWDVTRADIDRFHLEAWRDSLTLNDRLRLYERAYGHALQQDGDEGVDLVRLDGSPRPAYLWLRDWLRSRGS